MPIKLIECVVPNDKIDDFTTAQQEWSQTADADGFRGQFGGWDRDRPGSAIIVALWESLACHERFMATLHDRIVEASDQAASYETCGVSLWDHEFDIPGQECDSKSALSGASIVRIARCDVHINRLDHFRSVQREVWNPAMKSAGGMLHGWFCASRTESNRMMVCTLWRDQPSHDRYRRESVPGLRVRSQVETDCEVLTGNIVCVEPSWVVRPNANTTDNAI